MMARRAKASSQVSFKLWRRPTENASRRKARLGLEEGRGVRRGPWADRRKMVVGVGAHAVGTASDEGVCSRAASKYSRVGGEGRTWGRAGLLSRAYGARPEAASHFARFALAPLPPGAARETRDGEGDPGETVSTVTRCSSSVRPPPTARRLYQSSRCRSCSRVARRRGASVQVMGRRVAASCDSRTHPLARRWSSNCCPECRNMSPDSSRGLPDGLTRP